MKETDTMRFMMMHRNDAKTEAGEPPSMELIAKMGEFVGKHASQTIDSAGLAGSSTRTRLTFRDGRCTIKHGPYRGDRELPSAMLVLEVRTRDEAIGWAERYGKILVDGELELGRVNQPWDIGLMPMPENARLHVLLIDKADRATEAGGRSPQQKAALSRLKTEMAKAGVLLRSHALQPSSKSKRLVFANNDMRVLDGPFVESKELVGGFGVMELPTIDDAIAISIQFAAVMGGTLEVDIRPLDASDD
jgi:hypothetical protein